MSRTLNRELTLALVTLVAGALIVPSVFILNPGSQPVDTNALTYYTEQYPPYNYQENGTLKGVTVDLLGQVTGRIGTEIVPSKVHLVSWTEGYNAVRTMNKSVMLSMARTPERETQFKWAGPVFSDTFVLFASWDRAITVNNASDLNKYRIGVITDDASVQQLLDAGVNPSHLVNQTDASVLVEKLAKGEIDLWCYPEMVGRYLTQNVTSNYYSFRVACTLGGFDAYFAFSKDIPDSTVASFQKALDALKTEKDPSGISAYERVLGHYMPSVGLAQLNYLTEEWAPFNYMSGGTPAGVSVDILQAVFRAMGVDRTAADVHVVPLADALRQAQGNTSTVVFSIAKTSERQALYKWAGPFTASSFVLYAPISRNITISSAADLNKYRIGAVASSVENGLLEGQGVETSHIVNGATPDDLIQKLVSNETDMWATGDLTGRYEMVATGVDPNRYEIVYVLDTTEFYYAFSKDVPDTMVNAFSHALTFVRDQKDPFGVSEYERIIYHYLGVGYAMQTFTDAEVMALVNLTAAAIEANASNAFQHINAGETPYKDPANPGLYAFVYDTNVTMVAHADNQLLVGVNYEGKTDVTGKPFRDLIVSGALENGTGWVEYVYLNPAKTNLYYKTTYYRLVTGSDGIDYVVCAGNYKALA